MEKTGQRPTPYERMLRAWHAARLWLILVLGLVGTIAALSLPLAEPDTSLGLDVDDVAPVDVLAPYALSYTSQVLTEEARQSAAEAVPDQYDPPDSQIARQQLDLLQGTLSFISSVRADVNATNEQRLSDLAAITDLKPDAATAQVLLDLSDPKWEAVKVEALSVLERVMRNEIREDFLDEARRTVPTLVSISLPESQTDLVVDLVQAYVVPNAPFNSATTEAMRQAARDAVSPVSKSYAAGETIVERGQVINPLHIEGLEAFGLLKPMEIWKEIAVRALLVTVLAGILAVYTYRVHRTQIRTPRMAAVLSGLFVLVSLVMQLMIPDRPDMQYLFPAATLPILMAVLFGPGMGVLSSLAIGVLSGYLSNQGLEIAMYTMLSGAVGALVIGRAERMTTFVWAGMAASLAAVAVVVIFRFLDPASDALEKATLVGSGIGSGLLSSILALGLLLPIGILLGVVTNLQLVELSRPDHPLLQLILREAPGTYQHSLQVANLAEQAARTIGANPLLTRVGALYHDAGKALRPQFFIENQIGTQNVHAKLDPTTSASIIMSHVVDGIKLARKYRLPPSIQAFISEHHGTMLAAYQYQEALEAASGDQDAIDRTVFTYPGPEPGTRETALIMLADSVEAKARAEMPKETEDIDALVRGVIKRRLDQGQLDHTALTLRDLDTIRESFVNTLKGIYHPRIRYPETSPASEEAADTRPLSPIQLDR